MLQITPHQKFFLCIEPVDFRCGIDGLAGLCKQKLLADPMSGVLFVFSNRKRTAVKILTYDGQGFWLCMKRFSKGRLAWWPQSLSSTHPISASHLQVLLSQGDPSRAGIASDWKQIQAA